MIPEPQRYSIRRGALDGVTPDDAGMLMLAADARAWVEAAVAETRTKWADIGRAAGYDAGYANGAADKERELRSTIESLYAQGDVNALIEVAKRADQIHYEQGAADERDRIREAVEGLGHDLYCATEDTRYSRPCNCLRDEVLAIIDALKEDK